ncbi:unnamed protein product [Rotaria socialis]|uniref:Uncharacterized protein n=1 Tax=Rotaria socialis TaxID=392032 RepID=A0A818VHW2_9BILA|nr:unnamed protein product [Rotaria socialis]
MILFMILQCNRGSSPACLDWSEICNGQIDCADREIDEEHCWQLELNECKDDEYRCTNGQSISRSFVRDYTRTSDCIDGSDEVRINSEQQNKFKTLSPSFEVDDRTCSFSFLTSSCVGTRNDLLLEAMYSVKDSSISEQCWFAFRCVIRGLMDTMHDCPQRDDENMTFINTAALIKQLKIHFKCELSNKYVRQSSVVDRKCHCEVHPFKWCEDESLDITYTRKNISFQTICDEFTELFPVMIEERNETECELWSCNNIYTRCDGLWNFPTGEDEAKW